MDAEDEERFDDGEEDEDEDEEFDEDEEDEESDEDAGLYIMIVFQEMYCGVGALCDCLSLAVFLQYCTNLDVTLQDGSGCPLVVHCGEDLHSVHCTGFVVMAACERT